MRVVLDWLLMMLLHQHVDDKKSLAAADDDNDEAKLDCKVRDTALSLHTLVAAARAAICLQLSRTGKLQRLNCSIDLQQLTLVNNHSIACSYLSHSG
jgi:hypothetical protein